MINPWQNFEIKSLKIGDENYPEGLKRIEDAPETLFYRGELTENEKRFAVVGTRRASDYGKEIAYSFAYSLSKAGLVIVSGMARGIDSFAHRGALDANGKTIAVLGTGLDEASIYPRENLKLAEEILEKNGALLSEYPEGTAGAVFTFPQRNRIISGISQGVLIVEAKQKSGALITADWAKKQGKKIFAVPGSVKSENSYGPNLLIKNNLARLVCAPEDILRELKIKPALFPSILSGKNAPEEKIIKTLQGGALHIDKIIEKSRLSNREVSSTISELELEGIIKNLGGNVYILTI